MSNGFSRVENMKIPSNEKLGTFQLVSRVLNAVFTFSVFSANKIAGFFYRPNLYEELMDDRDTF